MGEGVDIVDIVFGRRPFVFLKNAVIRLDLDGFLDLIQTNGLKIRGRSWALERAMKAARFAKPTNIRHHQKRAFPYALQFSPSHEGILPPQTDGWFRGKSNWHQFVRVRPTDSKSDTYQKQIV